MVFLTILAVLVFLGYNLQCLDHIYTWETGSLFGSVGSILDGYFFRKYYKWEDVTYWLQHSAFTAIIAASIVLILLFVARRGGWFLLQDEIDDSKAQRNSSLYQRGFVALMFILALFPSYMFYRLLTPEPYPQPSGDFRVEFEELVEIGKNIDPHLYAYWLSVQQDPNHAQSEFQVAASPHLNEVDELFSDEQLRLGLYIQPFKREADMEALSALYSCLQMFRYSSPASVEGRIQEDLLVLRVAAAFQENTCFVHGVDHWAKANAVSNLF